jgi:DNA-binding NtrC family response regulator
MPGSRGKVLIIDDDESLRVGCQQALESSGFTFAKDKFIQV